MYARFPFDTLSVGFSTSVTMPSDQVQRTFGVMYSSLMINSELITNERLCIVVLPMVLIGMVSVPPYQLPSVLSPSYRTTISP